MDKNLDNSDHGVSDDDFNADDLLNVNNSNNIEQAFNGIFQKMEFADVAAAELRELLGEVETKPKHDDFLLYKFDEVQIEVDKFDNGEAIYRILDGSNVLVKGMFGISLFEKLSEDAAEFNLSIEEAVFNHMREMAEWLQDDDDREALKSMEASEMVKDLENWLKEEI